MVSKWFESTPKTGHKWVYVSDSIYAVDVAVHGGSRMWQAGPRWESIGVGRQHSRHTRRTRPKSMCVLDGEQASTTRDGGVVL